MFWLGPAQARGADLDVKRQNQATPLLLAAHKGFFHIVQYLLAAGCNPCPHLDDQASALWIAARNGFKAILHILLDAGADINGTRMDGATPLYAASENNHVDVVDFLISRGADPNWHCSDGATPMFIAAQNGHVRVIDLLIKANANIECIFEEDGSTPLIIACHRGHIPVVKLLLKARARQCTGSSLLPYQQPILHLGLSMLRDSAYPSGHISETCLMTACQKGRLEIVDLLLATDEGKSLTNQVGHHGLTALHYAAYHGYPHVVERLLKAGANVSATDCDGSSPLWVAAWQGYLPVVRILHQANPLCIDIPDIRGATPLLVASEHGHVDTVQFLISNNAKLEPSIRDHPELPSAQASPLFLAARRGLTDVVMVLLNAGANVHTFRPFDGASPFTIAAKRGHLDVLRLLWLFGSPYSDLHGTFASQFAARAFSENPTESRSCFAVYEFLVTPQSLRNCCIRIITIHKLNHIALRCLPALCLKPKW